MKFHLDYTPATAPFKISHNDKILLVGSCFAENIGQLLTDRKFNVLVNPSGIIFNPVSLSSSLNATIAGEPCDDEMFLNRDGLHLNYLYHSSISGTSKTELVAKINDIKTRTKYFLKSCNYLVITFGSAFVYTLQSNNKIVANCHKQQGFDKKLLTIEEISKSFSELINNLQDINPSLKIIFTVSPVKYLRDGVEENSLSKATLLVAIHQLIKTYNHCFYFPAYELMTDDLRDYRFYKEDLAHPNDLAIQYIWEKFEKTFCDTPTLKLNAELEQLNRAKAHRPTNGSQSENQKLQDYIHTKEQAIRQLHPELKL